MSIHISINSTKENGSLVGDCFFCNERVEYTRNNPASGWVATVSGSYCPANK